MTDDEWNQLSLEEIRAWADEVGANVLDLRDRDDEVVCEWGTGKEVHFHADGAIVLQKIRMLGGAEKEDTVERQGSRIVINDHAGDEHRISGSEFPLDHDYE
jgi:hypothetical protein